MILFVLFHIYKFLLAITNFTTKSRVALIEFSFTECLVHKNIPVHRRAFFIQVLVKFPTLPPYMIVFMRCNRMETNVLVIAFFANVLVT